MPLGVVLGAAGWVPLEGDGEVLLVLVVSLEVETREVMLIASSVGVVEDGPEEEEGLE